VGNVMPLWEALTQAAFRTATDDPRFPPISPNELPYLDLDVWLLGPPEEIAEQGEDRIHAVTIGKHGLQVIRGGQRGLLLPGVAVENEWDAEEFLNRTCMKAGLPATAWRDDDTRVFRFEGTEHEGTVLSEQEATDWPRSAGSFSPRDIAAYAQFAGESLRTLMQGATPLYYCPSVSDGNVNGVCLRVGTAGGQHDIIATRLNLKQTMPLQATLFSLCEELAQLLNRQRIRPQEMQLAITILSDPNMHGTVADPDLSGILKGERAILVAEGNRKAWVFDDDKSPEELFEEAVALCEPGEPAMTLVMSLRVDSSRSKGQVVDRPQAFSGQAIRPPAVAGMFYPGTKEEIDRWLDEHLPTGNPRSSCAAAMVPHAGWTYSGKIAADVLSRIEFPKTIIIIGPKHTPLGVDWAVAPHAKWSLPGGELDSDPELAKRLAERIPGLELDALAHQKEHGIEVELPIIRRLAPGSKVVGIALGGGTLEKLSEFAERLAEVIREMPESPLLLISSDMNHFASDTETRRLDELALSELDKLDAEGLFRTTTEHHISMCGMRPAVVILKTLQHLGRLNESQRAGYATSADATGEKSRVVGYAGMLFR
jgi:AmmeMemoRadiSam system protein B/AmmeMemoRadiSam system protein A